MQMDFMAEEKDNRGFMLLFRVAVAVVLLGGKEWFDPGQREGGRPQDVKKDRKKQ